MTAATTTLLRKYPLSATVSLTLSTTAPDKPLVGVVYTLDAFSNTLVLLHEVVHTTLTSNFTMVNLGEVVACEIVKPGIDVLSEGGLESEKLGPISERQIQEKERRALALCQESLKHLNQDASKEAQALFDTLVKACNDVEWVNQDILVLNEVIISSAVTKEAPHGYGVKNCKGRLVEDGVKDKVCA